MNENARQAISSDRAGDLVESNLYSALSAIDSLQIFRMAGDRFRCAMAQQNFRFHKSEARLLLRRTK